MTPEKSAEMARPIIAKAVDRSEGRQQAGARRNRPGASHRTASAAPAPGPAELRLRLSRRRPRRLTGLDANGADTALSAAAATVSREASGIAGGDAQSGARYGKGQGQTVTETGPDGVKRKVRIVGPTL